MEKEYPLLDQIQSPQDVKKLDLEQLRQLAGEIRSFLIHSIAKTGGHLSSNLGVVELTLAIHKVFQSPTDRIVFDVGHQSYTHKLLTGRKAGFSKLRKEGGLSGFPKQKESIHDAFLAGHSSTSISAAYGIARGLRIRGSDAFTIAVVGDGSFTGGMIYEAMNNAGRSNARLIVILNQNDMSISRNVGGLAKHLSRLRSSEHYLGAKQAYRRMMKKLPGGQALYLASSRVKNRVKQLFLKETMFENMGLTYLGPVDGHDLPGLISLLSAAKDLNEPVLLHVLTKKGKGYSFAEEDPAKFHGIGKFDPETGKKLATKVKTFSDSLGECLEQLAQEDPRICAITAAMPGGTGILNFQKRFPSRTFDVGIAEEHAVTFAAGLASQASYVS